MLIPTYCCSLDRHIFRTVNNTERVFKNAQAMKVREIEAEFPGEFSKIYPYVKGELYRQSFQETGDTESSCWSCGQSIGLINKVQSCRDLVAEIVRDADEIIRGRLNSLLVARSRL